MQKSSTKQRMKGDKRDSAQIKTKFLEKRKESIISNPLKALNSKQQTYIKLIEEKPIIVATGFAGTSKTYIPTVMAADLYKLGKINKIIITRPALSTSKSIGYTSGNYTEKMSMWLGATIPVLKERWGNAMYDIALAQNDLEFVPLEVIKGMSINDAFMIVEESSDLTKEEVIKLITRMGKNSTLILAGDIRQSELKQNSGLTWLVDFIERHKMQDIIGWIDFNSTEDIVRSAAVKRFIVNLVRDEKRGMQHNER